MIWFSSAVTAGCVWVGSVMMVGIRSGCGNANGKGKGRDPAGSRAHALFEARADEVVEVAVEDGARVAHFDVRAQVLHAALVEHVRTDLVAPAHIGLARFELVLFGLALAHFNFVQARFQHRHRFGAVAVLRAVVLALHDDTGRHVRDPHRGVGLVDVLTARARCAVRVDAQVGRVDLDFDRIVDFRVHEHRRERRVAAARRVERRLAHEAVDAVSVRRKPYAYSPET